MRSKLSTMDLPGECGEHSLFSHFQPHPALEGVPLDVIHGGGAQDCSLGARAARAAGGWHRLCHRPAGGPWAEP